jgi:adenylosuccinate lyase
MLHSISPIDGRYRNKTENLSRYFSEYGLIRYRVLVEIEYLLSLLEIRDPHIPDISDREKKLIKSIHGHFSEEDAFRVKDFEETTNHDVKAVEYFIKAALKELGLGHLVEWVHFALTSQDINNTAIPLLTKDATLEVLIPALNEMSDKLNELIRKWKGTPILTRTHGQPASPSTMSKELQVFHYRLSRQMAKLKQYTFSGKFGGATGNFNAHLAAFPGIDWKNFADKLLEDRLGIRRQEFTTQIENYDDLAELFQIMMRINTILIDLCRDIWMYIAMEYFSQKTVQGEIGSSTMPHKVNPIDFENAEGNLGLANAILNHLAAKLPVSRLQRDLTDSTVTRNVGVPFAHSLIACTSILKGLERLEINKEKIDRDLEDHWVVVTEAIQTILRREGYPQPYEALKDLTSGNKIGRDELHAFVDSLEIPDKVKKEINAITPGNYSGYAT